MLMNNLSIIVRQMRVYSERKLLDLNLGFPEQVVLMFLSTHDNSNQDHIAKYFEIDKGAITKTIQKLEEKKFIVRQENVDNRREKLISLSQSGKQIVKVMSSILSEWDACVYDGISKQDRQKLEEIIEIVATNSINLIKENKD
jgi:MarR family transcriptional regulator, transcriptional regulator for hemolysin